jgi:nicotinate (nicotinamide) nucleotide adenylyltransferase
MCELAFEPLPAVEVSAIESELGGTSRTLRLVEALSQQYPGHRPRLLVGSDILAERDRWQDFDRICARAPLLVAQRPGYGSTGRAPQLPEVSSNELRTALGRGEDVGTWLPAKVREYIRAHGLYTGAA